MTTTRRQLFRAAAACSLTAVATGSAGGQAGAHKKRVLAILGDAYHAVAPLDAALVGRLRKAGWEAVTIMDYTVPWNDFARFDLIILSREGHEYVTYFRDRDSNPANTSRDARWLTPAQEEKFEQYVLAGGRLFLYHDGFGYYPKGGAVSRLAKSYFIRHPAIVPIQVAPTGKMPELTAGVTPFTVADEEYEVEMDEGQTSVFLESRSAEHGRAPQGWAHPYGKGRVAILIPGHNPATISNPMVQRCAENITRWLTSSD
jgi:hypothetical protein